MRLLDFQGLLTLAVVLINFYHVIFQLVEKSDVSKS